ncbi:MAG TPA: nucleotide disphospho-sugar-binding domain-containing protein [Thermoanaerobaculia bacterium]
MASILIATVPFTGHVHPGLPIARELVSRGHDVRWYTAAKYRQQIERTGARYVPLTHGLDVDDETLDSRFPERLQYKGLAQLKYDIRSIFIDMVPLALRDLEAELEREPADIILTDNAFATPALMKERRPELKWAVFGISVLTMSSIDTAPFGLSMMPDASPLGRLRNRILNWSIDNVVFRSEKQHYQKVRRQLGLPETKRGLFDAVRSADVILQSSVEAFEFPRTDLPPTVKFIGPFLPGAPTDWTPPGWWHELDAANRPVVLVTQGTIANDYDDLLRPAIRALAKEDVFVVVTTGSRPASEIGIEPLPSNVRVEQFIPYARLMPKVALLLTNGGYGSIQIALAHGVPVVASGKSEEKPEIANRVKWSGVGIGLHEKRLTSVQVTNAVREVLDAPHYRERAEAMQREIARTNAPRTAAEFIEELAGTEERNEVAA